MQKERGKKLIEKLSLSNLIDGTQVKIIENEFKAKLNEETKILNVLIIENHIQIIESYKQVFEIASDTYLNYNFNIETAITCEDAISKLESKNVYDIILLDIRLPPYPEKDIFSGEDISLWIDKNLPIKPKIIINTFSGSDYRLYTLYQKINPDGFIIKDEATHKVMLEAIKVVIESPPFYSKSILKMIRKNFSQIHIFDHTDRKMLYQLSIGATTKDLIKELNYSETTIGKKKSDLFTALDVDRKDLRKLILKAKRVGLI